jgi:peptidoglycan hydrolase-like protein with peptidoglycan-binding domain
MDTVMRYNDFKIVENNVGVELQAGPPYPQEEKDAVRALQTKLEELGYTVGNTGIDGKYGPRTTRAVAAYKTDFNISTPANSMSARELEQIKTAEPKENPTAVARRQQIDIQPVDDLQPTSGSFNGRESRAATVRFNNPGGMYPASWQRRFGGEDTGARIGGGHRIAMFPNKINGAAALFALLDGSLYRGKTLADALTTWTGNNNVRSYIGYMQSKGIDPQETVANFLANQNAAIALATSMARWETGHVYPMSEEEWREAYNRSGVA